MNGFKTSKWMWFAAAICVVAIVAEQRGCTPVGPTPVPPSQEAVAGTYFYEQRLGDPPQPVASAISKLNERVGFTATMEDVDTLNKAGTVPKQYELTLPEAKKVGIPAWVTRSETKVLKSVKNPQKAEEILETAP